MSLHCTKVGVFDGVADKVALLAKLVSQQVHVKRVASKNIALTTILNASKRNSQVCFIIALFFFSKKKIIINNLENYSCKWFWYRAHLSIDSAHQMHTESIFGSFANEIDRTTKKSNFSLIKIEFFLKKKTKKFRKMNSFYEKKRKTSSPL